MLNVNYLYSWYRRGRREEEAGIKRTGEARALRLVSPLRGADPTREPAQPVRSFSLQLASLHFNSSFSINILHCNVDREAENAFLEEREESAMAAGQDATPAGGAAWERVARLCDFNPKNSKCTKDVSRFRGMLLQLKSPNSAAAGATADGAAFN